MLHGEARALIIHIDKLSELAKVDLNKTQVETIWIVGDGEHPYQRFEDLMLAKNTFVEKEFVEDLPAVIFYTSGSTGNPKAVVHSRYSTYQLILNGCELLETENNSRLVIKQPLGHAGAYLQTFSLLAKGGTVILTNDVDEYIDAINKYQPTMLVCLPSLLNELFHHPRLSVEGTKNVKFVTSGGDKVPVDLQKIVKQRIGVLVKEHYGSSEVMICTKNIHAREDKVGSMGELLSGIQIKIVDESGNEVAMGETGEIWAKSPILFKCYYNNPTATSCALHDGWFKTGDLASVDEDGFYWFKGRSKQIIVRNGRKMTPQEIEEIIYLHPNIKEACVVAKKNDQQGEVPVVFVQLKHGCQLTEHVLLDFIRQNLAEYRIPEAVFFVDKIKRNTVGKIDRKGLEVLANEEMCHE